MLTVVRNDPQHFLTRLTLSLCVESNGAENQQAPSSLSECYQKASFKAAKAGEKGFYRDSLVHSLQSYL